jgi:hypothetical protein
MADFISENLSTIIIAAVVLGFLAFALVRTIRNFRGGGCGCGCSDCPRRRSSLSGGD